MCLSELDVLVPVVAEGNRYDDKESGTIVVFVHRG